MEQSIYTTKEIDEKFADFEKRKADRETLKTITTYGIASLVAITGCIGGLYILYYSGLAELKTSVAVLSTKVETLTNDVSSIKGILSLAEVTK